MTHEESVAFVLSAPESEIEETMPSDPTAEAPVVVDQEVWDERDDHAREEIVTWRDRLAEAESLMWVQQISL